MGLGQTGCCCSWFLMSSPLHCSHKVSCGGLYNMTADIDQITIVKLRHFTELRVHFAQKKRGRRGKPGGEIYQEVYIEREGETWNHFPIHLLSILPLLLSHSFFPITPHLPLYFPLPLWFIITLYFLLPTISLYQPIPHHNILSPASYFPKSFHLYRTISSMYPSHFLSRAVSSFSLKHKQWWHNVLKKKQVNVLKKKQVVL